MVDQSEVGLCVCSPLWLRVDPKFGERKLSSLPPHLDSSFNFRGPEKIGLLRSLRRFRHHGSGAVHVIAPNLVLGAIAAVNMLLLETPQPSLKTYHCGNVSSQRICLLLQVLQPFRDLV